MNKLEIHIWKGSSCKLMTAVHGYDEHFNQFLLCDGKNIYDIATFEPIPSIGKEFNSWHWAKWCEVKSTGKIHLRKNIR